MNDLERRMSSIVREESNVSAAGRNSFSMQRTLKLWTIIDYEKQTMAAVEIAVFVWLEALPAQELRMQAERAKLVELLRDGKRILLFTGAGISTGSGIPDFRGPEGVWKKRQPVYYHDFMRSEPARIEHWEFKLEGWAGYRDAKPNATHEAIVRLEKAGKVQAVVTQNIDGLHARAGTSPEKLIELHGTNSFIECQTCGKR